MSQLRQWLNLYGWVNYKSSPRDGICFYGSYGGYVFNLIQRKGYKEVKTYFPTASPEQMQGIVNHLEGCKKSFRVSKIVVKQGIITIIQRELFSRVSVQTIEEMLQSLTEYFQSQSIPDKHICPHCGVYGNHDCVSYRDIIIPLCKACYQELQQNLEKHIKEVQRTREIPKSEPAVTSIKERKDNYFTGILGALLGGILASSIIPFIIYSPYLQRLLASDPRYYEYSRFIVILVGLGIYGGYKILRGKDSLLSPAILISITMMSMIVLMLAFEYYESIRVSDNWSDMNPEVPFFDSVKMIFWNLFYSPSREEVWKDIFSIGKIACLGLIPYLFHLKWVYHRVVEKFQSTSA